MRITRFTGATARRTRTGEFVIDVPARRAVRHTDAELTGVLAHELMHVVYRDPYAVPVHQSLARLLLAIAAPIAAVLLAIGITWLAYLTVLPHDPPGIATLPLIFTLSFVALILLAAAIVGRRIDAQDAHYFVQPRPVVELRTDLAAVQLVGSDAVLAMLTYHRRGLGSWEWGRRAMRGLDRLIPPTHPELDDRITAVAAYDPSRDPASEARRLLARSPT